MEALLPRRHDGWLVNGVDITRRRIAEALAQGNLFEVSE